MASTPVSVVLSGTDVDSESLIFTIVDLPNEGDLSVEYENYIYTPAEGFIGSDSFIFRVSDEDGNSADASVNIAIAAALDEDTETELETDAEMDSGIDEGTEVPYEDSDSTREIETETTKEDHPMENTDDPSDAGSGYASTAALPYTVQTTENCGCRTVGASQKKSDANILSWLLSVGLQS